MKASGTLTEMLKFSNSSGESLAVMNFRMSGWWMDIMPMLAPRRKAPCWMALVASQKTRQKLIGPLVRPPELATMSPVGRRRSKEKPVPPPAFWIRAVCLTASKMSSTLSWIGRTKQALSMPRRRPAFISVGLLGRNSPDTMAWRKRAVISWTPPSPP